MKKSILNKLFIVVVVGVVVANFMPRNFVKRAEANSDISIDESKNITLTDNSKQNLNISNSNFREVSTEVIEGEIVDNVQVIEIDLETFSYPSLTLQKDVPVKFIINADENNLNWCNNKIVMQDFELEAELKAGRNVIEFTPTRAGDFIYTCWMGMIGANITITDEEIVPRAQYGQNISVGGCCSSR